MKKLLSKVLALTLCTCTMIGLATSASAAGIQPRAGDVNIPSSFVNQPILINSKADGISNHSLNILAASQSYISNGKNVTTWPTIRTDTLQQWRIIQVTDKYYRISNAIDTTYSLDYYWGSSDYQNCKIYSYPSNSTSYGDFAVTFRKEGLFDNTYGIVKVRSDLGDTECALTVTNNTVATSGRDVRWIVAPQTNNTQIWKLEKLS